MAYKRISPQPVVEGGTGAQTLTGVCIGNGTSAITGNAVTQHDVLVGGASNAITSVAPSATSGVPLISQGASSDPAFGTAVVAGGGTGDTSFTAYAVICGGTSSTGALQSIAALGSSGNVLTSNGAGALPTFQAAGGGGITTIDGDSGSMTGSTVTISGGTTGLTTSASSATMNLTGTLVVANGGTGVATMTTAYAPVCAGTTATGALQVASTGLGTSGNVLTSNGSSALPSFQAAPGGGINSFTLTLTNAQIKAMHATPITLIAAPGSGKMTRVVDATAKLDYGGTNAFTDGGSAGLDIFYTSRSGTPITTGLLTSAQITATSNQTGIVDPAGSNTASTAVENVAVVVSALGATEIAGNAANDNTITVNIGYKTLSL